MRRHETGEGLAGGDDACAVGADESHAALGLVAAHVAFHLDHVARRDAVGDADTGGDARIRRLHDAVGGKGRRHEADHEIGAGLGHRALDRVENGQPVMLGAALAGGDPADHVGAVLDHVVGVKAADAAREAGDEDAAGLIYENGHHAAPFAELGLVSDQARTTRSAASARVSAVWIGRPLSAIRRLPSSTLVPERRTTSGMVRSSSRTARTTPSAIQSQRLMPAKMLTRIASTLGSLRTA